VGSRLGDRRHLKAPHSTHASQPQAHSCAAQNPRCKTHSTREGDVATRKAPTTTTGSSASETRKHLIK